MGSNQGTFHARQMETYGTKVVGGTFPGKGGQMVDDIPVYNSVREAMEHQHVDASILFVPAAFAKDCAFEAIRAGVKVLVLLPEHIPVHDARKCQGDGVGDIRPNVTNPVPLTPCFYRSSFKILNLVYHPIPVTMS
ncbi:hypothetical protein [Dehalobacterium formicoaceticum]|uniref:hypothetical protein n=1 Tax=Dehalobacterium formicoaceticum TaxID=51515 RepID=UPI001FA92206|nr:hypothetical protein [Dehalobacterium formicoaceticum]